MGAIYFASGIVAESGASLHFDVAPNTYIQGTSNGSSFELKDGIMTGLSIDNYSYLQVSSGGTASNTSVESKGNLWVYSGGTAADTVVHSGGSLKFFGGGIITGNIQVEMGGKVDVY